MRAKRREDSVSSQGDNLSVQVCKYRLYAEAEGSTAFIIPEDFMTSAEGIINTLDPIG